MGVTGWCWGGGKVWLACERFTEFKAGVAWYGPLKARPEMGATVGPLQLAKTLHAPVLGLYGGKDQGIPLETVERMQAALAKGSAAAKASRLHVYAEAGHAFNADYRPSYAKGAAEDGWKRCLDWFAAHGVAAS
jgi:carboxymethylenebutenolidase